MPPVCTILLAFRCCAGAPIVLGANRDELIGRASLQPATLMDSPRVWGGRDLVAGGTWLALRQDGALAAVTNRHPAAAEGPVQRDPARRSRGLLPLAVLETESDAAAEALMRDIHPAEYNPGNLLYVSRHSAFAASFDDDAGLVVRALEPGLHVLGIRDVDDSGPKDAMLRTALDSAWHEGVTGAEMRTGMVAILKSHESATDDERGAACIHGVAYGTVSSSTIVVYDDGRSDYWHASGLPCENEYTYAERRAVPRVAPPPPD